MLSMSRRWICYSAVADAQKAQAARVEWEAMLENADAMLLSKNIVIAPEGGDDAMGISELLLRCCCAAICVCRGLGVAGHFVLAGPADRLEALGQDGVGEVVGGVHPVGVLRSIIY